MASGSSESRRIVSICSVPAGTFEASSFHSGLSLISRRARHEPDNEHKVIVFSFSARCTALSRLQFRIAPDKEGLDTCIDLRRNQCDNINVELLIAHVDYQTCSMQKRKQISPIQG